MRRHELSNEQWEKIKDLLPPERKPQGGRPAKNNRIMMNGIIYWLNTGVAWRDLPERFEPWQSVYGRFRNWAKAGIWEKVFNELIKNDIVDYENLMIDSTIIKIHQHANGLKKGASEAKGRSRGGLITKVHAGYGNPLKFMLTAGNVNDSTVAEEMLSSFNLKDKYIYADKGYDTASIVRYIENQGGNAVIPSKCNAVKPRKTDWFLYKERHLVENLFLKAKNFKIFAMRYDKSAVSFSAVVYIAFILIWLH